ncbi:putative DNA modification/repair radical SAM protein [Gilvimarinus chinensis]|uniref:putative DNA modification/repair radical SAM protein n=1 Tax=Gilvimarinus chinensis TaxID=396005 RepID=UPI00036CFE8E|nr:putative DNA modification/repair radical SAM protein [Gilvimarinus chinensis]
MSDLIKKLAILADAAKYDASCASSGTTFRDSAKTGGIGSSGGMGICHSYTPDGRCISLLKVLLTNFCIYECSYCVNRASSNVPRARFSVDEVVKLCLDFYKRNYIEGLFLSSGIIQSADYTMEQVVAVARKLRIEHGFRGYIHLKTIPEASKDLLAQAGLYADRLSINVELPSEESLQQLAPEKSTVTIESTMGRLKETISEHKAERKEQRKKSKSRTKQVPDFSPAGQSTQMIIGADNSNDAVILNKSHHLYRSYEMRRVYYSAFSPIPDASSALPLKPPPLIREHRLYQADWLMRFYHFKVDEITQTTSAEDGMLDLDVDPKFAWALQHREYFPVDVNRADYEQILRIPGVGVRTAQRILQQRRFKKVRIEDFERFKIPFKKIQFFVQTANYSPSIGDVSSKAIKQRWLAQSQGSAVSAAAQKKNQLSLF